MRPSIRPTNSRPAALVLAALAALPCVTGGQDMHVAIAAGQATDERGTRANAMTVAPSVWLGSNRRVSAVLGATATRFEGSGWQAGGSATVAARTRELAGAVLSFNAGGGVSRTSFDATFTVADLVPAIEYVAGPLRVFGGARVASGRTSIHAASVPAPVSGGTTLVTVSRMSAGPVFGGDWSFGNPFSSVQGSLVVREERARVRGVIVRDRTAGAVVAWPRLSLGVSGGERRAPAEQLRFVSTSASIALGSALRLEVAVGAYPSNPLTGTAAGRFVTTGLAWRISRSEESRLPAPRGVGAPPRDVVRLSIHAPDAREVELYGDWNGWTPIATRRAENGVWYADISLPAGEYRYAFRINAVEWRVPEGAATVNDGFGGKSAYVIVARRTAQAGTTSQEVTR